MVIKKIKDKHEANDPGLFPTVICICVALKETARKPNLIFELYNQDATSISNVRFNNTMHACFLNMCRNGPINQSENEAEIQHSFLI